MAASNILDLTVVRSTSSNPVTPATARYNQDADNAITILDLTMMAGVFLQSTVGCP